MTTPASSQGPAVSVLVTGEALIDVVVPPTGMLTEHVGGSPANVAVGLAALGHPTALATHIGADEHGQAITTYLEHRGVRLCPGSSSAGRTSTATAHVDAAGIATYDFQMSWSLPEVDLAGVGHLHTGSIACTMEPGASQTFALVDRAREQATVSYDPNLRPSIMGTPHDVRSRIEEWVGRSDVVKASSEDIAWLYDGAPVADVAHLWSLLGPGLVVVTRGPDGALVIVGEHESEVPSLPAQVVDTVGAGDSFMAGLVSGLLDAGLLGGPPARQRLRAAGTAEVTGAVERAIATATYTIERAGAASPSRADLS